MPEKLSNALGKNLSANLKYLRAQRGLTQAQLAKQGDVPRSTLATLETGEGNPTLTVLASLSLALQVSIEELLSTPRAHCQLFPRGSLPSQVRGRGQVIIADLLPDPIPGMHFERMEIQAGARITGVPHRPGTREYLCCEQGELTLWAAGERARLSAGDVVAFQGDQRHSYLNEGTESAVGFSVVALVPLAVARPAAGFDGRLESGD